MRTARFFAIAALIGLGAASLVSSASAQNTARDAVIHKCVNEAAARFPNVSDPNNQRNRTDVYRECMGAAGMAP